MIRFSDVALCEIERRCRVEWVYDKEEREECLIVNREGCMRYIKM